MRVPPFLAGTLLGASGVALGAFGAHGLERVAVDGGVAWWETAVRYQLVHAVVLLVAGVLAGRGTRIRHAPRLLLAGVVLFSGSLYALALGAPRVLGAVTPVGGVLLVAGWLALAVEARGQRPSDAGGAGA